MKKGTKISRARRRNGAFTRWYNQQENAPVVHMSRTSAEVFERDPDEVFYQCKDPYPVYWYVSEKGHVLNFSDPDNPYVQNRVPTDDPNRYAYKYPVHRNGERVKRKGKDIERQCKTYHVPLDTMQAYGKYTDQVYGEPNDIDIIEYHHELGLVRENTEEAKQMNDNPKYLLKVVKSAHPVLTYAEDHPIANRTRRQEEALKNKLVKTANITCPDKVTLFYDAVEGRTTLRTKDDMESFFESLPEDLKLSFALQVKAFYINSFLYKACPEIDAIIYPSVFRDTDTNNPVFAVFIYYERDKYQKQRKKGYVAPVMINTSKYVGAEASEEDMQQWFSMNWNIPFATARDIANIEVRMSNSGVHIQPEIHVHYHDVLGK